MAGRLAMRPGRVSLSPLVGPVYGLVQRKLLAGLMRVRPFYMRDVLRAHLGKLLIQPAHRVRGPL